MKYKHILFDWGNTLMVDFKGKTGPMCDWDQVEAVPGAEDVLTLLSRHSKCYAATNAGDSSGEQVMKALSRVGLGKYLTKIYASTDMGFEKPAPEFFQFILKDLQANPENVLMIGDNLEKDVLAAQAVGIKGIWLNPGKLEIPKGIESVESLLDLI